MSTQIEITEQEKKEVAAPLQLSNYGALENFTKIVNTPPPPTSIQKTPDGNAETMTISFVETKLDEVYLRQWGTEDVTIMQIANEVTMCLTLWVVDPLTKQKITRTGCAAVQITVDKRPANLTDPREKNAWALDMQNKKPNALYLAFPKLKSLAIKNAAQTLGKIFGRDLNRKNEDTPDAFYENLMNENSKLSEALKELRTATTADAFTAIWNKYTDLQPSDDFKKEFMFYQRKNIKK